MIRLANLALKYDRGADVLSEVNFQAMFEAQQAQASAQIGGAGSNGSGVAGAVN